VRRNAGIADRKVIVQCKKIISILAGGQLAIAKYESLPLRIKATIWLPFIVCRIFDTNDYKYSLSFTASVF
jgi:hypothetical protein